MTSAMQIYTKILIGMGLGAIVGITLGPESTFLPHDLYKLKNGKDQDQQVVLQMDCNGKPCEESRLWLPTDVPFEVTALEDPVTLKEKDKKGDEHELPTRVLVEFNYSKGLALKDKAGKLRFDIACAVTGKGRSVCNSWDKAERKTKLKEVKSGQTIRVWLIIRHEALKVDSKTGEGGGFRVWPVPISSIGAMIASWLSPIGEIFMRLISMVIVPLVFSSLLVGVASLGDVRKLGRMGGKTIGLYLVTTAIAVTIGLVCANVIKPGDALSEKDKAKLTAQFDDKAGEKAEKAAEAPSAVDNLVEIIPVNPVWSLVGENGKGNMLQIIFFAILFGVALTMMGKDEGQIVITFFDKVQAAMVVIIHIVMKIAPYGVFALVAEVVGASGLSVLKALLVYSLTVLVGLAIHTALVYGSIVKFLAKLKIGPFLRAIRPAQLVGFSTSSSSATLPVSMECAEENLGVSNSVSSFVLPLGSTVNMDGTALYQGVAAVFIAQVFGMDLGIGEQLAIVGTATMASVGAAGVPGAGMVTLAMVLTATGIPAVGVALILGMDRLLDMFRTAVNVTGDLSVTAAMATTEGETLQVLTPDVDAEDPDRGFEGRLDKEVESIEPE